MHAYIPHLSTTSSTPARGHRAAYGYPDTIRPLTPRASGAASPPRITKAPTPAGTRAQTDRRPSRRNLATAAEALIKRRQRRAPPTLRAGQSRAWRQRATDRRRRVSASLFHASPRTSRDDATRPSVLKLRARPDGASRRCVEAAARPGDDQPHRTGRVSRKSEAGGASRSPHAATSLYVSSLSAFLLARKQPHIGKT